MEGGGKVRRVMSWILIVLVVIVVGFGAYVRLAPQDASVWHKAPSAPVEGNKEGSAMRAVADAGDTLARLDAIAMAEPRTVRLAGSAQEGKVTYVSRSALWGFPDYTTVWAEDGKVWLYGRLRFGRSDLGVNGKRLDRWIGQL